MWIAWQRGRSSLLRLVDCLKVRAIVLDSSEAMMAGPVGDQRDCGDELPKKVAFEEVYSRLSSRLDLYESRLLRVRSSCYVAGPLQDLPV